MNKYSKQKSFLQSSNSKHKSHYPNSRNNVYHLPSSSKTNSQKPQNKLKSKNKTSKQQNKKQKQIKPFQILKKILHLFHQKLPSQTTPYAPQSQGNYTRYLSQISLLLQNKKCVVPCDLLVKVLDGWHVRQLVGLFCNLTQHKQIVIGVWVGIYRNVFDFYQEVRIISRGKQINSEKQNQSKLYTNDNKTEKENPLKSKQEDLKKLFSFLLLLEGQIFESINFMIQFEFGIQGYQNKNNHSQSISLLVKYSFNEQAQLNLLNSIQFKYQWLAQVCVSKLHQKLSILNPRLIKNQAQQSAIDKQLIQKHKQLNKNYNQVKQSKMIIYLGLYQFSCQILKHIQLLKKLNKRFQNNK